MKTVQFITHYTEKYSYLDSARMALKGGCRWIQLRMKDAGKEEIVSVAMELRNLCNDCGAIFIIDDHVELVREIGADGVHLGKNDMSVAEARRIQKLSPILGLEGYKEIIRKMQEEKICHLPVVAIGGITFADIPAIMQTGVTGIALSGTVLRADNPVEEMRKILAVINQTDNY